MKKINCKRVGCVALATAMLIGTVLGNNVYRSYLAKAESNKAMERLQKLRNETESVCVEENSSYLNEKVRAIITLKDKAVADKKSVSSVSEYSSILKSKEDKVISNQEDIIKQVEKITGNKVAIQTGYLVNSFSIDATRKQLKKIAKIEGIVSVEESVIYEICMETAINQGNVTAQIEDTNYPGIGAIERNVSQFHFQLSNAKLEQQSLYH